MPCPLAEGKLLAKVETTGTTYFHHDHLGSSKLQTDDSGNVVSSDVTQPFGPRICADAVKDEFATLDRVNTVASTIAFDATNGVVKTPHGANGYQTGELYTTELKPGVAARVVKLGWTGSGVTFYVSTDGNTWTQLQKDQPLVLGTSTRSLYLKAVLAADASSFLGRYLLQINPTWFNLFTGKMLTEETGLVYFGARWYDPEIGRWITPDPSEDGENWYGYCGNNPVNYVDLEGFKSTPVFPNATMGPRKYDWKIDTPVFNVILEDPGTLLMIFTSTNNTNPITGEIYTPGERFNKVFGNFVVTSSFVVDGEVIKVGQLSFKGGAAGENYLRQLIGGSSKGLKTASDKWRWIDAFLNGIAHEGKVGYVRATNFVRNQIIKDVELRETGKLLELSGISFEVG
jgi:RHS repeat-associated protein